MADGAERRNQLTPETAPSLGLQLGTMLDFFTESHIKLGFPLLEVKIILIHTRLSFLIKMKANIGKTVSTNKSRNCCSVGPFTNS